MIVALYLNSIFSYLLYNFEASNMISLHFCVFVTFPFSFFHLVLFFFIVQHLCFLYSFSFYFYSSFSLYLFFFSVLCSLLFFLPPHARVSLTVTHKEWFCLRRHWRVSRTVVLPGSLETIINTGLCDTGLESS